MLRLPESADELQGVLVWEDLRCLAHAEERRGSPGPRVQVALTDQDERDWVRSSVMRLGHPCCPPTADDVAVLVALARGLRLELAAVDPGIELEQARSLLSRGVAVLADHTERCRALRAAS